IKRDNRGFAVRRDKISINYRIFNGVFLFCEKFVWISGYYVKERSCINNALLALDVINCEQALSLLYAFEVSKPVKHQAEAAELLFSKKVGISYINKGKDIRAKDLFCFFISLLFRRVPCHEPVA